MATRTVAPLGEPCWIDLSTTDVDMARRFYTAVLGWEAGEASAEFGGYFMFFRDGVPVAGAMPDMTGGAVPSQWTTYFAVADAAETLARAAAAGAQVVAPAMQVGSLGTMGVAIDPTGAPWGVWAPLDFQGFGVIDEVGAPRWFELHTRDYDAALDFYTPLFAWQTQDMSNEDMRYRVVVRDGSFVAGIFDARSDLAEDTTPHWSVYVGVADVDAALTRALAEGGTVTRPAVDTPYGRMANVRDPAGASIALMQS